MRFFPNPYTHPESVSHPDADVRRQADVMVEDIIANLQSTTGDVDGGLYVGPAGVAYALWYAAKCGACQDPKDLMTTAHGIIKFHKKQMLKARDRDSPKAQVGFLLGHSGVYAVHAVISRDIGDAQETNENLSAFTAIKGAACTEFNGRHGSDELLVGRAGYVSGALWLRRQFGADCALLPSDDDLAEICRVMINIGRRYSAHVRSPSPLMYHYHGTEYLGAAHGVCTILQMLLSVPASVSAAEDLSAVKSSVDYLLSIQSADGNIPCAMDEVPSHSGRTRVAEHELVHWCHGAPGMIYLFAKAWLTLKDEKYKQAALKCGECIWQKGLLKKGPGICHGVAGNGYAFLLLYRMTRDSLHLQRARCFAHFMTTPEFRRDARRPDCPFSLYEGTAGTVCYLADLLNPERAEFPFLDPFQ